MIADYTIHHGFAIDQRIKIFAVRGREEEDFRIDTEVRCVGAHPPFWPLEPARVKPNFYSVYSVMSIYIAGARRVCVILKILLHISRTVIDRLCCVLVR